ncbi:MAG: hypothetical protein GTO40_00590 [Deltaproteobacteria bacterium]|nr:hypothetical protein [Deltaproteobacteria bacterium]
MAEEKPNPATEEVKWWIERGPVREREKKPEPNRGIIDVWAYELLKDYNQDLALKSVAGINERVLKNLNVGPKEWDFISLNVGKFPPGRLNRIKEAFRLPAYARGLIIDAGYSVRVLMTGEPVGDRLLDINFTEVPSLDYWIHGELVEERLFRNFEDAIRKIRPRINRYLSLRTNS